MWRALMCCFCLVLVATTATAQDCPKGVDPSYCAVANATGGTVITGTPEEINRKLQEAVVLQPQVQSKAPATPVVQDSTHQMYFIVGSVFPWIKLLLFATAAYCFIKKKYQLLGGAAYGVWLVSPILFHGLHNMAWEMRWSQLEAPDVMSSLEASVIAALVAIYVFYKNSKTYVKAITLVLSYLVFAFLSMVAGGIG